MNAFVRENFDEPQIAILKYFANNKHEHQSKFDFSFLNFISYGNATKRKIIVNTQTSCLAWVSDKDTFFGLAILFIYLFNDNKQFLW